MTVIERDLSERHGAAGASDGDDRKRRLAAKRLRGRNLAVLAALLGMVVLFYAITVVRLSAGH